LLKKKFPTTLFLLQQGKIVIRNIRFSKVEGEKALSIGNMTVINPSIRVINKLRAYNDTAHTNRWFSHLKMSLFTSTNFDAIVDTRIDNIFLKNATFVYINDNEAKRKTTAVKNIDVAINNISTDALANKDSSGVKQAIVKIGRQRILTADKLYYVDLNNTRLIPADK